MGRNLPKVALWSVPLIFVAVLFYWPLAKVLELGFKQSEVAFDLTEVVTFTIGQALVSTIICLGFGLPGAFLLYRKSFFGVGFFRALIAVPFVLPTVVVAIALNSYRQFLPTILVILVAHLFLNYSIVVRTVGGVWATLDVNLELAAQLDGASGAQIFRRIVLPQLRPAIASAAALAFLYCVTSFGVILVLGGGEISSIETNIYFSLTYFLDFKTAGILALIQTAITLATFVITRKLGAGDFEFGEGQHGGSKVNRRNTWQFLVLGFFVILVVAIPLLGIIAQARFDSLNEMVWLATANSARNLLIAGFIAVVFGTLLSWLLSRTRAKWLETLFLLPLGVSTVVLGFGYLIALPWLRSTWFAMPLIQALLAMPLVIRMVYPALVAQGVDLREEASTAGANHWQTFRYIEAPLITPVLQSAMVYSALISLGEFGAASLLTFGNQVTLPVVLYQMISRPGVANYRGAMTIATILIIAVFVISLTTSLIQTSRRSRQVVL